jgi:hypothetical protein
MLYFILPDIMLIPLYVPIACVHMNSIPTLRYKVKSKPINFEQKFTFIPIVSKANRIANIALGHRKRRKNLSLWPRPALPAMYDRFIILWLNACPMKCFPCTEGDRIGVKRIPPGRLSGGSIKGHLYFLNGRFKTGYDIP